jgi:membrane protein DedA with SNARE-associated domain
MSAVTDFITGTIRDHGYLAIFVLMVLESACIPIPSEVTMLFGGALANAAFYEAVGSTAEPLNFVLVALVGTLGNLVGSWIAYGVGYFGGRPLVERYGRFVFLREHELERAEAWWAGHGEAAVFFSRLLPVVRTFISLPAGIGRMPFGKFTLYTILGCLPWTFALAGLGYALGQNWETVERYLRPISIAVVLLLAAAFVWWLVRRSKRRRAAKEAAGASEAPEGP